MRRIQDARILIVDDQRELLTLVCDALRGEGYLNLYTADSVRAAREAMARTAPELIILDVNLPDGDGFALFQELRAMTEAPVLFLSARDADSDRLFGLGLGADDYLTKPFLTRELLLRVQLVLRRFYRAELGREARIVLGDRVVDLDEATVTSGGGTVPLTATELAILKKLVWNRGRIVTYDALCEAVWGANYYGYENSLNVHMRHLREKLEENPSQPRWLVTARGLGYKLVSEASS